jgi:FKBP-type peptidyl-prolyl cis-trans isomerase FkpA
MRISRGLLAAAGTACLVLMQGAGAADTAGPAAGKEKNAATAAPQPSQDVDFYVLGLLLSRNLDSFSLSQHEYEQVLKGFEDGYRQQPKVADVQPYLRNLQALATQRTTEAGAAFISKAAALPGARKTESGLVYIPSVEGSGATPKVSETVKVNYEGKLVNGTVFDSSIKRGQPATFPLGGIIPCWKEALQLMKVGGKARVVCPASLAYGDRGAPGAIPPGATLDFQIELLDIMPPTAPKAPPVPRPSGAAPSAPTSSAPSPSTPH